MGHRLATANDLPPRLGRDRGPHAATTVRETTSRWERTRRQIGETALITPRSADRAPSRWMRTYETTTDTTK